MSFTSDLKPVLSVVVLISFMLGNARAEFTTVLNIPETHPNIGDFQSIDANSQVNLSEGGTIGENFLVGLYNDQYMTGIELNISGGEIGDRLTVYGENVVNITGGKVGEKFASSGGTEVNMTGGEVGEDFEVNSSSILNLSGGKILGSVESNYSGIVNISGGEVQYGVSSSHKGKINMSGGVVGYVLADFSTVKLTGGKIEGLLNADENSDVVIAGGVIGGDVQVNNVDMSSGEVWGDFRANELNMTGGTIKGNYSSYYGTATISEGTIDGDIILNDASLTGGIFGKSLTIRGDVGISGGVHPRIITRERFASVTLSGSTFYLDGVKAQEPDNAGEQFSLELDRFSTLSGELADGTPFYLSGFFLDSTFKLIKSEPLAMAPNVITVESDDKHRFAGRDQTVVFEEGGTASEYFLAGRGSTVEVQAGKIPDHFTAIESVVNINGGEIGHNFEADAGTVVNLSNGSLGNNFKALSGSVINISGGNTGYNLGIYSESVANISGGSINSNLTAYEGSVVNISGGTIGPGAAANQGSVINITGGEFIIEFYASPGGEINIYGGDFSSASLFASHDSVTNISGSKGFRGIFAADRSTTNFLGTEFYIDGLAIEGLNYETPLIVDPSSYNKLTGILRDGTAFDFASYLTFAEFREGAQLTVMLAQPIPESSTLLLTLIATASLCRCQRS